MWSDWKGRKKPMAATASLSSVSTAAYAMSTMENMNRKVKDITSGMAIWERVFEGIEGGRIPSARAARYDRSQR